MNFEDRKNYYEVLEVAISSTHQDIMNAYLFLMSNDSLETKGESISAQ